MFKNFSKQNKQDDANVVAFNAAEKVVPSQQLTPEPMTEEDKELQKFLELKSRLHEALLDRLNFSVIDKIVPEDLRREVANLATEVLAAERWQHRALRL